MSKAMQSVLNLLNRTNTWLKTQIFNGGTIGNNYQINGGYRFWGNDTNGVVMFYGADSYPSYGNQIMEFGVNVTQQANSGGLPSPTATYGGGLLRYDLRTGNPSTLVSLASATGNAEFYILLQPSGTAGESNPIFGCSANGIVGTIYNIIDDGSGNMKIAKNITTGKGGTAPTAVTVPASGTAYTPSTSINTILFVSGGTVTGIAINGVATGLTSGVFPLKANDTITFTYIAPPTVYQMSA